MCKYLTSCEDLAITYLILKNKKKVKLKLHFSVFDKILHYKILNYSNFWEMFRNFYQTSEEAWSTFQKKLSWICYEDLSSYAYVKFVMNC